MRKFLIVICCIIAAALMVVPIILIFHFGMKTPNPDIAQLIYYSAAVVGGMGALYAVIIALFGSMIKDFLYAEDIQLDMSENELCEDREDNDEENVVVRKYYTKLCITNIGRKKIRNCELKIKDITYGETVQARQRSVFGKTVSSRPVPHNVEKKIALLQNQSIEWPVLYIHPDVRAGLPEQEEVTLRHCEIVGFNLHERESRQGVWRIKYMLQSSEKVLKEFELEVSWTGQWRARATEMNNEISTKLIQK